MSVDHDCNNCERLEGIIRRMHESGFRRGSIRDRQRRFSCPCGWVGEWVDSMEQAQADHDAHVAAALS